MFFVFPVGLRLPNQKRRARASRSDCTRSSVRPLSRRIARTDRGPICFDRPLSADRDLPAEVRGPVANFHGSYLRAATRNEIRCQRHSIARTRIAAIRVRRRNTRRTRPWITCRSGAGPDRDRGGSGRKLSTALGGTTRGLRRPEGFEPPPRFRRATATVDVANHEVGETSVPLGRNDQSTSRLPVQFRVPIGLSPRDSRAQNGPLGRFLRAAPAARRQSPRDLSSRGKARRPVRRRTVVRSEHDRDAPASVRKYAKTIAGGHEDIRTTTEQVELGTDRQAQTQGVCIVTGNESGSANAMKFRAKRPSRHHSFFRPAMSVSLPLNLTHAAVGA